MQAPIKALPLKSVEEYLKTLPLCTRCRSLARHSSKWSPPCDRGQHSPGPGDYDVPRFYDSIDKVPQYGHKTQRSAPTYVFGTAARTTDPDAEGRVLHRHRRTSSPGPGEYHSRDEWWPGAKSMDYASDIGMPGPSDMSKEGGSSQRRSRSLERDSMRGSRVKRRSAPPSYSFGSASRFDSFGSHLHRTW